MLVAVAGALVYGLSGDSKIAELGRLCFACAMLALMLVASGHSVRLF